MSRLCTDRESGSGTTTTGMNESIPHNGKCQLWRQPRILKNNGDCESVTCTSMTAIPPPAKILVVGCWWWSQWSRVHRLLKKATTQWGVTPSQSRLCAKLCKSECAEKCGKAQILSILQKCFWVILRSFYKCHLQSLRFFYAFPCQSKFYCEHRMLVDHMHFLSTINTNLVCAN